MTVSQEYPVFIVCPNISCCLINEVTLSWWHTIYNKVNLSQRLCHLAEILLLIFRLKYTYTSTHLNAHTPYSMHTRWGSRCKWHENTTQLQASTHRLKLYIQQLGAEWNSRLCVHHTQLCKLQVTETVWCSHLIWLAHTHTHTHTRTFLYCCAMVGSRSIKVEIHLWKRLSAGRTFTEVGDLNKPLTTSIKRVV